MRLGRRIAFFILFFLCYETMQSIFLSSYSTDSVCMSPTLLRGDRLLATSLAYGPRTVFGKITWSRLPDRGDIVIVDPPYSRGRGFLASVADSLIRFVTFQRVSLFAGDDPQDSGPLIQRVIGLPGDVVLMEDSVYKIRQSGSEHFLTEFELSRRPYDISRSEAPELWKLEYPASGRMEMRYLAADEFFIDSDDRSAVSGSRLWGPVSKDRLLAKALFRYWPFTRFGAP